MTIGTGIAQLAFVRVLFAVAGLTVRRRISVGFFIAVTATAARATVFPFQQEVGVFVVEGGRVQANNIGAAAQVFTMALLARVVFFYNTAMKSGPGIYIRVDFFVTVQAQAGLRVLAEA